MPGIFALNEAGFRTQNSNSASTFLAGVAGKVRWHHFAGPGAIGLMRNSTAMASSLQWGTGPSESPASTSVTANYAAQEPGGSAHTLVSVDAATGNATADNGRFQFDKAAGTLRMSHNQDDALVSSNPRVQLYTSYLPARCGWMRIYMGFQLGDANMPWPKWVFNLNSTLILQIKDGSASFPPLTLDIYDNSDGDTNLRDLVLPIRTDNVSSQTVLYRVKGVKLATRYNICLDVRLDWLDRSTGGAPSIRLWQDTSLVPSVNGLTDENATHTIYPPSANYVYPGSASGGWQAMWGIYRYRYSSVQAPDGASITFHKALVEHWLDEPPTPTWP